MGLLTIIKLDVLFLGGIEERSKNTLFKSKFLFLGRFVKFIAFFRAKIG